MGTLSTRWITQYVWAVLCALLVDIGDAYFWGGTTTTTPGQYMNSIYGSIKDLMWWPHLHMT